MFDAMCKREVVIIGAGVAGIAAFVSAVRNRSVSRIDIVDPRGIGNGVAFATSEPELLCNTSVETMSLLDDDPYDFLHYLRAKAIDVSPDAFVPRFHVSRYLADRYADHRMLARDAGIQHRHLMATARTIEKQPTGGYRVLLEDGTSLEASDVVICTGSGAPFLPDALRPHIGAPAFFECLYPERRVMDYLAMPSRVLIVGSRLSAVDAALLACGAGAFRGDGVAIGPVARRTHRDTARMSRCNRRSSICAARSVESTALPASAAAGCTLGRGGWRLAVGRCATRSIVPPMQRNGSHEKPVWPGMVRRIGRTSSCATWTLPSSYYAAARPRRGPERLPTAPPQSGVICLQCRSAPQRSFWLT